MGRSKAERIIPKAELQEQIDQQVQQFLKNGGVIQHCNFGDLSSKDKAERSYTESVYTERLNQSISKHSATSADGIKRRIAELEREAQVCHPDRRRGDSSLYMRTQIKINHLKAKLCEAELS